VSKEEWVLAEAEVDRAVRRPGGRSASPAARWRLAILALGGASLLSGLNAALVRLEVWAPVPSQRAGDMHGLVMVLGFLGTLVSLERAQALGRRWGYAAPVLLGAGALVLLAPVPPLLGELLLVDGCAVFVAVYVALWQRAPRALVGVQVLSSVLALAGAVVAARVGIPFALPAFFGFIVLTIASERAELAQLSMGPTAERSLMGFAGALTAAIVAALTLGVNGQRAVGVVLIAVAWWLLRRDVVRRQLGLRGQHRYLAAALCAGYLQLGLAGTALAIFGLQGPPGSYEVIVHGVFLGFAVSMVMAHAPVILPAVIGRALPYRPVLWVPLAALHLGLAVRFIGAALGNWQAGGVVTVVAMLAFLLTSLGVVLTAGARR
jgi:hypothetical protein